MSPTTIAYGYLTIAIVCEVIGTTFLVKSEQFTRLGPTLMMGALYALSFYLLAQTLKVIPFRYCLCIMGWIGHCADIARRLGAIQAKPRYGSSGWHRYDRRRCCCDEFIV